MSAVNDDRSAVDVEQFEAPRPSDMFERVFNDRSGNARLVETFGGSDGDGNILPLIIALERSLKFDD